MKNFFLKLSGLPGMAFHRGNLHFKISFNCLNVEEFRKFPNAIKIEGIIYYKNIFYDQNEEALYVSDPLEIKELDISYVDLKVKPVVRDMDTKIETPLHLINFK